MPFVMGSLVVLHPMCHGHPSYSQAIVAICNGLPTHFYGPHALCNRLHVWWSPWIFLGPKFYLEFYLINPRSYMSFVMHSLVVLHAMCHGLPRYSQAMVAICNGLNANTMEDGIPHAHANAWSIYLHIYPHHWNPPPSPLYDKSGCF